MTLWLVIAGMTAAAVVILLWPLVRKRRRAPPRDEYDLAVYRDQLGELRVDVERGILSPEEESAARLEVQRRVLSIDQAREALDDHSSPLPAAVLAALVLAVVPALALGLYVWRGSPEVPTQTATDRAALQQAAPNAGTAGLGDAVAKLADRLEREPDDLDGWLLLGRSYMILGRYPEAVNTYRHTATLAPSNPAILGALGEAMVLAADGHVTPAAREVIEAAFAIDPTEPAARYYLGIAKSQSGDVRGAFDAWLDLARDAPAAAPWLVDVIGRLRDAADQLDIDLASLLPAERLTITGPDPAVAAPSAEDVAAAADMTPEQRMEMIRGMVAGLAARLEEHPDDLDGWQRLARSYEVLGETSKAAEARARAETLRQSGTTSAEPTDAPPGPDAEDVESAAEMSPEERQVMIRDVVQGLATRLESDPRDVEGWLRLARSYEVLGEEDDARRAMSRAAELRPDDIDIQSRHATALMRSAEPDAPLPPSAVDIYRHILELDPGHADALFFTGLSAARDGHTEAAVTAWTKLLGALEPGSPAHDEISRRIEELDAAP